MRSPNPSLAKATNAEPKRRKPVVVDDYPEREISSLPAARRWPLVARAALKVVLALALWILFGWTAWAIWHGLTAGPQ